MKLSIDTMKKNVTYNNVPDFIIENIKQVSYTHFLDAYSKMWGSFTYRTKFGTYNVWLDQGDKGNIVTRK